MKKVILLILLMLPAIAVADSVLPACPGSQLLSKLILNDSACANGYEFSDFWSISGPLGINPSSTVVEYPVSTSGEPSIEFTAFTVDGGNAGALGYEIISYMVSALKGEAIESLNLEVGALQSTYAQELSRNGPPE